MTKRLVAAAAVLRAAHLRALPADIRVCAAFQAGGGSATIGTFPGQAGLAEAGWSFLPFIFGIDDADGRRGQLRAALARYITAMVCHHRQDQIVQKGRQSWLESSDQSHHRTGGPQEDVDDPLPARGYGCCQYTRPARTAGLRQWGHHISAHEGIDGTTDGVAVIADQPYICQ